LQGGEKEKKGKGEIVQWDRGRVYVLRGEVRGDGRGLRSIFLVRLYHSLSIRCPLVFTN
jgi:hypothetical protein